MPTPRAPPSLCYVKLHSISELNCSSAQQRRERSEQGPSFHRDTFPAQLTTAPFEASSLNTALLAAAQSVVYATGMMEGFAFGRKLLIYGGQRALEETSVATTLTFTHFLFHCPSITSEAFFPPPYMSLFPP